MLPLDVLADFQWFRNSKGYRLVPGRSVVPADERNDESRVDWIIPNGEIADETQHRPFARGGDLCAAFASVRSADQLLRFVNGHGPLTHRGNSGHNMLGIELFPAGEPVTIGLSEARNLRELMKLQALGDSKKTALYFDRIIGLGSYGHETAGRVEILPDLERGIRLKLTPQTLLGAMWYQLALKFSESIFRMCPVCHRVFGVGRGTTLRADARFCCNEHKVQFFNQRRTKRSRVAR